MTRKRWALLGTAAGATLATLTTVGVVMLGSVAANAAVSGSAYVWADQPTLSSYTPNTLYQYNSAGSTNTITRQGTGQYTVTLPGLGASSGTVLVTAYGPSSDYCKVVRWGPASSAPANQTVNVRCFTAAGALDDSQFTVTYTNRLGAAEGWVWANNPTSTADYFPASAYSTNSAGTQNWIRRIGVGVYLVYMPFTDPTGSLGDAEVTAYGSGSEYCTTAGSGLGRVVAPGSTTASLQTSVQVDCFTPGGAAVDTMFTATYVRAGNVIGGNPSVGPKDGFPTMYADSFQQYGAPYTITASTTGDRSYLSGGGTIRFDHLATGSYVVHSSIDSYLGHGNVQVTSDTLYQTPRCKPYFWSPSAGIRVLCFSPSGQPVDADFNVNFVGGFLIA